jgi:Domain of unknown function (DUF4041)/T5orf172 domain
MGVSVASRLNVPPNWPKPPVGWEPAPGWQPSPEWGPPPAGWQLWVEEIAPKPYPGTPQPPAHASHAGDRDAHNAPKISFFGARGRANELSDEVTQLRAEIADLKAEAGHLRAEMAHLGTLDALELEDRRQALRVEIEAQQVRLAADLFRHATELEAQATEALRHQKEALGRNSSELGRLEARLQELGAQVVVTEDAAILQEVGVYQYRHPLTDAAAYREELARLQDSIKSAARSDNAISAAQFWTVNGSAVEGRRMVRDFSKLMLRAYNAEADNLVRGLKPYKLSSAIQRLEKVVQTIERLGKTMSIRVDPSFHRLRVKELEMTADYLEKVAVEKERVREERERLREEAKVQQEIERERQRLEKERQHYLNAVQAMEAQGDAEATERLLHQLGEINKAIADVDYRAANIRAGYVYVISNVGAFGPRMIKVGLTRRLEPMDRVRELGDASVPFRFDVHALYFSKDAVGIEAAMHARLADRRVNRVNMRREFFYATLAEARGHLLDLAGDLLQFEEMPEALEFHQSGGEMTPYHETP